MMGLFGCMVFQSSCLCNLKSTCTIYSDAQFLFKLGALAVCCSDSNRRTSHRQRP